MSSTHRPLTGSRRRSEPFAMNSGNVTPGVSLRPLAHTHAGGLQTSSLAVPSRLCHHRRVHHRRRCDPAPASVRARPQRRGVLGCHSVPAESLSGMFYYSGSLQATPPLRDNSVAEGK